MAEVVVDAPNGHVEVTVNRLAFSHGGDALKAAREQAARDVAPRRLTGVYGVKQDGDTLTLTFPLAPE